MRGMNREQCLAIMYILRDHAQKYELGVNIIFDSLTLFTMWQLQEVVISYLVTHYADDEDKEELLKAFKAVDVDQDGKITREELYNAFKATTDDARA